MATKKRLFTFSGPATGQFYAVVSPSGKWLVSSTIFSKQVSVWKIANGKMIHSFPALDSFPKQAAFSKDEKQLAVVSDQGELVIWDFETRKELKRGKISPGEFDRVLASEVENFLSVEF